MASDAEHGGEYFEEPHLRFNVGDRVSASIGAPGERKPGTIMLLNYSAGGGTTVDKIVPYQIILDDGGKIYSEGDDDSYVKAIPTPVLRFKVGDRVSANVDDGWKPGTIVKVNYIPSIDHILKAEEQVPGASLHTRYYSTSWVCSPSHVSFVTFCAWKDHARWRRGALPSRPG